MRYLVTLFMCMLLAATACKRSSRGPAAAAVLNTGKLPATQYTIDINKDTLLHTSGGAWLKIDKGSFSSSSGKAVLEIKEAFSLADMVKGGLATQSNGQPLMSGGMMYIGAAAGQDLRFQKPVRVAVPADFLQAGMQLYKGQPGPDSSLNWTEPRPLDNNPQLTEIEKGAALFATKCASCHGIGRQESGPDLAHVTKRGEYQTEGDNMHSHHFRKVFIPLYIDGWETDTAKKVMDYEHRWSDPYICNLITLFGNREIDLSDDYSKNREVWDKIYAFIQNESDRRNLPLPQHAWLDNCIDSCNLYTQLKADLTEKKEQELRKKEDLEAEQEPMVDRKLDPTWRISNSPPPDFADKVEPGFYDSRYYQFTIETFGWINVDALLGGEGVQDSELTVTLTGAYTERVQVYLIIPSHKVLGQGGPTGKKDHEFAFFKKNGALPLPQNTRAFILAVTEDEKGVAYGLTPFTTSTRQQLQVSLQPATTEAFNKAIEGLDADRLQISAAVSKKAAALRNAEKTIAQLEAELKKAENLKPKGCDCNCGAAPPPPPAPITVSEEIDFMNINDTATSFSIIDDTENLPD